MRSAVFAVLVVLLSGSMVAALGDIVVFKNGSYEDCKIKNETETQLVLEIPHGEIPYPRSTVYWYQRSSTQAPGIEYYQAGLKMLELRKKQTAAELFSKAGLYDKRYERAGEQALEHYSPNRPTDVTTMPERDRAGALGVKAGCAICGGTGYVAVTFAEDGASDCEKGRATTTSRCPACGGNGHRVLWLRPSEGYCPECKGCGSIRVTGEQAVASWYVDIVTCPKCSGTGKCPLRDGGSREGIQYIGSNAPPAEGEVEEEEEEEDKPSSSGGGIAKYKWYLLGGGGALLLVALAASQMSGKKSR